MDEFIVRSEDLKKLLSELSKTYKLIAPVKNEFDEVLLSEVQDPDDICLDFEKTLNSAKDYFLPQRETIFSFVRKGDSYKINRRTGSEPLLIFGLRPCDTRALQLLDKFFGRNFEDDIYLGRRRPALIFTMACPQYWQNCFCNAVGGGPVLEDGFEVQLIPLGDKFCFQIGRLDGDIKRKILKYLRPLSKKSREEVSRLKECLRGSMPPFDLQRLYKNLKKDKRDPSFWRDIARRCQRCGLCLFVCPACSCFTMLDNRTLDKEEERARQWDACYFLGFTRLAGGNNPVRGTEEMIKRKYRHKLLQQLDEFGMPGCTGCGRCVEACVGNINWFTNLTRLAEVDK